MTNNPLKLVKGKGASCLVLPHINPDGDTIGASFALSLYLQTICDRVAVVLDEELPANLQFLNSVQLTPVEEIENELDTFEWVFSIDASDRGRLGERAALLDGHVKTVNVDHHKTNDLYADFNVVEKDASSTGEIMYKLLKDAGAEVTAEMAESLYVALSTDTGSFRYSNTAASTMRIAADLIECGIDLNAINTELYQNKPLYKSKILRAAMNTMQMYLEGRVVTAWVDQKTMDQEQIEEMDTEGIAEYFRDISGVEVVLFVKEKEPGFFRASLRSKHDFDVAELASTFGGGGHAKAAGCAIVAKTAEEAASMLLQKCQELLTK